MFQHRSERDGGPAPRLPSLLFVNKYYAPDVAATGQILADLAEYLAARGYDVSVMASRQGYSAAHRGGPASERLNGVKVTRVRGTSFGRARALGRLADYASYYVRVLARLLGRSRYDGVIFLTTPPLLAVVGFLARAVRGQRYGVWSMDLHPDAAVAAGMLASDGLPARGLHALNSLGYRHADFVVDLGPYMRRRIAAKGVPPERSHTVHVWSGDDVAPLTREANPLARALGLADRFVVMYSGNAGVVHEFGPVLEAMRLLRDDPDVFFLFVGGGPQRARIEEFARANAVRNFAYRDYYRRDELRHSLSLGDVHLVTLREEFAGIAVPSKVYGALAAARPILFVGPARSEPAEVVAGAGCGVVVDSSEPDAGARTAAAIRALLAEPERRAALGAAGRAAFLVEYDREPNCAAFERVIADAWKAPPTPQAAPRVTRTVPAEASESAARAPAMRGYRGS